MGWVRVSDDFYDHEKFAHVSVLGDAVWIRGLAYANRNLTDGFISERAARGLVDVSNLGRYLGNFGGRDAEPQDGIDELLEAGLWHAPGHDCDSCPQPRARMYVIHDYLVYQPSKAEVQEKRDATRDRVRKHRSQRGNAVTDGVTSDDGNAARSAVSTTPPNPNPNPKDPSKTSKSQSSPIGGVGADEDPDGLDSRARNFNFDGHRVRVELTRILDEFPDADTVMRVATGVLKRASSPAKDPTAYIVGAIRKSEFEIQKLAYGEAS